MTSSLNRVIVDLVKGILNLIYQKELLITNVNKIYTMPFNHIVVKVFILFSYDFLTKFFLSFVSGAILSPYNAVTSLIISDIAVYIEIYFTIIVNLDS